MNRNYLKIFGFAALGILASCKKDPKPTPEPASTKAVIIGNTGLTPTGSGSLTSYDPELKVPNNNAFQKANVYAMGPGLTSIYVDGDKTFLVMAENSEIIVINTNTYKVIKRFKGFGSPRYIVKATENKYYVSDWQEEGVHVLYYNQETPTKTIFTGLGPERMLVKDDLLFVTNSGGPNTINDSTVSVINTKVDTITTTLQVGFKPNSLQLDNRDQLWVLYAGFSDPVDPLSSLPGGLASFDLTRDSLAYYPDSILRIDSTGLQLELGDNQLRPHNLVINAKGDQLYYLDSENLTDGNIMTHTISSPVLSQTKFIPGAFYSIGFDMIENQIYAGAPNDYLTSGEVYRFNEKATKIDQFTAGIIPSCFGFK